MKHPGTSQRKMRKIRKIEFSKIKLNKNKLVAARNMKRYLRRGGGEGGLKGKDRERWVFLQLTTISAGSSFPPILSRDLTALSFSAQTLLISDFFNIWGVRRSIISCLLPPFSLIRVFVKQNTRGNVSEISVSLACYWLISTSCHRAVIGGFRPSQ